MSFYAVANGRTIGIFSNWNDCNNSVKGYKNAIYKKFDTKEEAEHFIKVNGSESNLNTESESESESKSKSNSNANSKPDYYVYTDGACSNNGRNNASAGIGIFFGTEDIRNVSKKIEGKQTNNTAELTAIIEAYYIIKNDILNGKEIAIVSDSEYAIKCVSSYGEKCYKNNWNVDIPNKKLVRTAYEMYRDKPNVQFIHIRAHTGKSDIHSFGNDNADKLARLSL